MTAPASWPVHLADAAIVVAMLEAIWLTARHRGGRRVPAPAEWALNLVSGACLMLALRLALAGVAWPAWATALAAAGAVHALDLALRWRRCSPP